MASAGKLIVLQSQRVLLGADLARIYGVTTGRLNEQVKRNARRFPEDFVFQLTREEAERIIRSRSQNAILKRGVKIPGASPGAFDKTSANPSEPHAIPTPSRSADQAEASFGVSDPQRMNIKHLPHAFTEHGAIQAAKVLSSDAAIEMGVHVVRAFVRLR